MKIEEWRKEIDLIDSELVKLVSQRATIAEKIGMLKVSSGLPVFDAGREEEVIQNACRKNKNKLLNSAIIRIYQSILKESRKIQIRIMNDKVNRRICR